MIKKKEKKKKSCESNLPEKGCAREDGEAILLLKITEEKETDSPGTSQLKLLKSVPKRQRETRKKRDRRMSNPLSTSL